ncbi:MAG: polysaccharide deacetylase family protein [Candidatus Symbiothrix sp.]|jgi:polysaccharide deacetylase family protein (PEP-CTERM system associated)|nr:polysaccharide deacetylase family protein [Candidatus Symbiothrix sp.]
MHILTFDIEDWWIYDFYKVGDKRDYLPRLNKYLNDILDVLDEKEFQATFFCLGIIAREFPEIIKLIDNRGHQIACHSDIHAFLQDKDPEFFYQDTKNAIDSLEQVIGKKVIAYRAPAFSFTEKNKWTFEILYELGIEQDCSIYPAHRSFGGFSSFKEDKPVLIQYNNAIIKEFPMSLTSIAGKEIAYSGGGYFRLLPYSFIKKTMQKNDYVITYFHLRDFDYIQKRVDWKRYIQSYYGLKGAYNKFLCLLNDFMFINLKQASETINWNCVSSYKL